MNLGLSLNPRGPICLFSSNEDEVCLGLQVAKSLLEEPYREYYGIVCIGMQSPPNEFVEFILGSQQFLSSFMFNTFNVSKPICLCVGVCWLRSKKTSNHY